MDWTRSHGREFQSTPSAWRVTPRSQGASARRKISIHTLRMEGDYPGRSASRARMISIHTLRMEGDFFDLAHRLILRISIHTLRMEGDPWLDAGRILG